MTRHALTAAQFRALASGYGDRRAIMSLSGGQLARRRLLIAWVVRRARALGGAVAQTVSEALAVLYEVEARAPQALRSVLIHPQVDVWASRCARLLRGGADPAAVALEVGYLNAIAVSAAVRAGLPFRLTVPVAGGAVTLPGLGSLRGAGTGDVRAEGEPGVLTLTSGDRRVRVPAPYQVETEHWQPRRGIEVAASGLRWGLAVEDVDQYRDCYQWPAAPRLAHPQVSRLAELCDQAWRLLVRDHPRHARAMREAISSLVPLRAARHDLTYSAASRYAFGAVGLAVPQDAPSLALLLLLHEFQHLKLAALLDLVQLHKPGGTARHFAPWRADPRPVGALLQGVYAHVAVADFWRLRRLAGGEDARRATFEFAYWRVQLAAAIDDLRLSGELTPRGADFVGILAETVAAWQAEPVPEEIAEAAARCALAATVSWRAAVQEPVRADVAAAARAWHRGEPCPAPARPGLRPAEGNPYRLTELIRAQWTYGVERAAAPVERALLSGDVVRATAGYAARARATGRLTPDDAAGLALCLAELEQPGAHGLTERPDLVQALYAEVADGTVEPGELSAWLERALAAG